MANLRRAATVLLVRYTSQPEVYLVQRHPGAGFFGGAFVFPGGAVDPADADVQALAAGAAQRCQALVGGSEREAVALFVAACREVFEEAGVLLAAPRAGGALPPPHELERGRRALLEENTTFADVLQAWDLQLTLHALHPWAHWITPTVEPKRFDTRFFVASMPADQQASIDAREAVDFRWLSPRAALDAYQAGDIVLPPPTFRNLEELAERVGGARELPQVLEGRPVLPIQPKIAQHQGDLAILLPWDPAYPSAPGEGLTPPPEYPAAWRDGPSRIVLRAGRWRSELG